MSSQSAIEEARSEANAILKLGDDELANLFFQKAMHRNLSRTVRHLDTLVQAGGADRSLGAAALKKLGFSELP